MIGFSSELSQVQVHRALIRREEGPNRHAHAATVLKTYARLPLAPALPAASQFPHQHLKSQDALHLATATSMGKALTHFITYDQQLAKFAAEVGLPVAAPGV
ncbi:MAG TPA: VapC toxin family PIN domain ribonuclease [Pseudonocardiaceae bacterium]|nr:VapC toxin family PIN domain ribonuclease [Pseudonocardiaceae bacterium]